MRSLPLNQKKLKRIRLCVYSAGDQEHGTACWPWKVLSVVADEEEETARKATKLLKPKKKKVTFSQSSTSSTAANKNTLKGIDKRKTQWSAPKEILIVGRWRLGKRQRKDELENGSEN